MSEQLPPEEVALRLKALRMANLDGMFATTFLALFTGTFLISFVKNLGGNDVWLGLFVAIPTVTGILQFPGSVISLRFRSPKLFVMPGALLWRLLYIPLIFMPVVWASAPNRLLISLACLTVGTAAVNIGNATYTNWLADLVPASARGYYFSRRNAILIAFPAPIAMLAAFAFDYYQRRGQANVGLQWIFLVGVICAFISQLFYLLTRDVPHEPKPTSGRMVLSEMRQPLLDPNYRRTLLFLAITLIGQNLAAPFYGAFALESLHLSLSTLSIFMLIISASTVLSTPFWGRFNDRFGSRPGLVLAGCSLIASGSPWLFCFPGRDSWNFLILAIFHTFAGFAYCGANLCQMNLVLAIAPKDRVRTYLGTSQTLQSMMVGLAPLGGAFLLQSFRGMVDAVTAYKVLFGIVLLVRLIAIFLVLRVSEQNSTPFKESLKNLRRA
ncbi:MAG: MFS transporter [Armatimonadetes bacterium]|nr:MFS transporter [Armatimonadota bacterium]